MRVLVLGVTGMLGSTVFREFAVDSSFEVWGTLRNESGLRYFADISRGKLIPGIDALDESTLVKAFLEARPDVVINCIGLIKHLSDANDPLIALPINAILPHRLVGLCELASARLIHISTDCVYSGKKGMYVESDLSDAEDLYGKSKYIGEVTNSTSAITLRTSIIGHELASSYALIDWFLAQRDSVQGYANAIFSGLPTIEIARVIKDYVIPSAGLHGLYHVSAEPIDKFSLLKLVANVYGHSINIVRDDRVRIDRSLDSANFRRATGYMPPAWCELVKMMKVNR